MQIFVIFRTDPEAEFPGFSSGTWTLKIIQSLKNQDGYDAALISTGRVHV